MNKSRTNWERLYSIKDEDIDYSDIPPLGDKFFEAAKMNIANIIPGKWQPIETAPKTGEHILVAEFNPERTGFGVCGGKKQSMMTVVHWWDNPGEEGWYASVDSQGEYPFPATHWKPLEELN